MKPHFGAIKEFIRTHLNSSAVSSPYDGHAGVGAFYVLYWIIYLALAIPVTELENIAAMLIPDISLADIRNRLYCMQLAGWTGRIPYSNKDYLYVRYDADPFDYAFRAGVADKDSIRRKFLAAQSVQDKDLPKHVKAEALALRKRLTA